LYFGLGLIPLFIGLAGRQLFPNLENPEYLIPLIAKQFLSPFGFTLFICGLLSAIMSTADSYLLAGTSLITNNILLKVCEIKDEKKKILFIRLIHILLALAALFLALHGTSIFCMMVHSGATLFVAIFIPATAALLLKKNNRAAAWCSLILGTGTWLLSMTICLSGNGRIFFLSRLSSSFFWKITLFAKNREKGSV
jgi:SSS family solute:Na+ symporter